MFYMACAGLSILQILMRLYKLSTLIYTHAKNTLASGMGISESITDISVALIMYPLFCNSAYWQLNPTE